MKRYLLLPPYLSFLFAIQPLKSMQRWQMSSHTLHIHVVQVIAIKGLSKGDTGKKGATTKWSHLKKEAPMAMVYRKEPLSTAICPYNSPRKEDRQEGCGSFLPTIVFSLESLSFLLSTQIQGLKKQLRSPTKNFRPVEQANPGRLFSACYYIFNNITQSSFYLIPPT